MKNIPWCEPEIGDEELKQVLDSFKTNWLTMGPKVKRFEEIMAGYLNVPYAIAVSNGSVALDLTLKLLGVGPNDEIIVPALCYYATAAAVSYQQAIPVFVDSEPQSFNLDPKKIENAIGPNTKGIIFFDYGGNPADIDGLKEVAQKNNLFLLHDGAHSLGGLYKGSSIVGHSKISTMSFHIAKVLTTVEGGMIFTNDAGIANELRIRRNQGNKSSVGQYNHSLLGTNARMTDIAASIGLAQFEKLPGMLSERKRVAYRYDKHFKGCESIQLITCNIPKSEKVDFHYTILVENRDEVVNYLKENGIDTRICWPKPQYSQTLYKSGLAQYRKTQCSVAERFTSHVINLPIFPSLKNEKVDEISNKVLEVVR